MPQLNEAAIFEALKSVRDPGRGEDIVSLGMISGLVIKQGNVGFSIEVAPERGPAAEPLRKAAERAVAAVPGVLSVTAVLTAHSEKPPPEAPRRGRAPGAPAAADAGVKRIVAVASGKGGVGKSTTAVNLALALSAAGRSVGILDADIYGPSLPLMLGITDRPTSPDGKVLDPMSAWGLKAMSIGFLIPADSPTIWRGPMVMGALEQLMRDVAWGELDVMIVDMPPGTGDVQLTMAQRVPLAGAVIVSTPQDLALIDARKGLNMFRKVDIPVLGVIENMSYFVLPALRRALGRVHPWRRQARGGGDGGRLPRRSAARHVDPRGRRRRQADRRHRPAGHARRRLRRDRRGDLGEGLRRGGEARAQHRHPVGIR